MSRLPNLAPNLTRGWRARLLATALLAGLTLVACGGGSGGGGGGLPTAPTSGITFTASGAGANRSIDLTVVSVTPNELVLEVRMNDIDDLYGLSFDLSFPASALRFVSASEEGFFGNNGNFQTEFAISENPTGNLVVGLTRLGNRNGKSGSGPLIELRFSAAGTASGTFNFSRAKGIGSDGFDLPVNFFGGSVSVVL